MKDEVIYCALDRQNFGAKSLDGFDRYQKVSSCWRLSFGAYVLKPVGYIEDWSLSEKRALAERILEGIDRGDMAYGAFTGGNIVGFAYLDVRPFGSAAQYVDLAELHVSAPFRGRGIGRRLFAMACDGAREAAAQKLYISAHSAEDSIAAYKSYGCTEAAEINAELAEKEPFDLQLEYLL